MDEEEDPVIILFIDCGQEDVARQIPEVEQK